MVTDRRGRDSANAGEDARRPVITDRRRFLGASAATAAVAAGAAAGGAGLAGCAAGEAGNTAGKPAGNPAGAATPSAAAVGESTVPFHGSRQAGIATPPQAHALFRAFDLAGAPANHGLRGSDGDFAASPKVSPAEAKKFAAALRGVLSVWSDDAPRLAAGNPGLADMDPELAENPSRLTVTVGFGPRLFDLIGMPEKRPNWLSQLPDFRIDRLDPAFSGGDLLLQIAADDPMIVANASRLLASTVRRLVAPRWAQQGFRRAAGAQTEGQTQRNLFGQLDGTVQPDTSGPAVFCGPDEGQEWMRGGSALVLRRIVMHLDTWEEVDPVQRDLSLGRRQSTGAPLTGTDETDPIDLQKKDRAGLEVIPPQSHVARAHARSPKELFLRRPYNFISDAGRADPEAGLLFAAYAADIERQFLPVQRRLAEADLLNTWTTPTGSAVFALPPGVEDNQAEKGGFLGDGLFA
ncbi:Dyp-type peroxidase [Dietzia sp.]|uniref:Dyp-type peroxidase n=1 Tax=Dietzia sp. TaxID=1871616 RepID=UPI002FDAEBDF